MSLKENEYWIREIAAKAEFVVGWGNPGQQLGRGKEVESILREVCDLQKVFCFGKNKNGASAIPAHRCTVNPFILIKDEIRK